LKAPACAGVLAQPGSAGVSPTCSLTEGGFWGSPYVSSPVSGSRTLKLTLLPVWEQGVGGMRGKSLPECRKPRIAPRNCRKPRIAPRNSTLESARVRRRPRTTWERGRLARMQPYGGGFFGKPLRAISRFRHQNAQTPPSPRVGEGGRGDGGKRARECEKLRIPAPLHDLRLNIHA
jgi:hypothetical protein